jgi:fatty-acyl-CoA synthase
VAAVVACDGDPVELGELREHCRASLAGYKLPRRLVVVDAVRRSPAGKPDHAWAAGVAAGA